MLVQFVLLLLIVPVLQLNLLVQVLLPQFAQFAQEDITEVVLQLVQFVPQLLIAIQVALFAQQHQTKFVLHVHLGFMDHGQELAQHVQQL